MQWQCFSGMDYGEPRLPCDASQIGRFRRLLGADGIEQLFKAPSNAACRARRCCWPIWSAGIVDSAVQSKAIAHPVGSRPLEIARHKAASAAKRAGMA